MKLAFTPSALKDSRKLSHDVVRRILEKLKWYAKNPDPLSHADRLVDTRIGTYRFRVGHYRAVCDRDGDTLLVLRIGHRRDIYK